MAFDTPMMGLSLERAKWSDQVEADFKRVRDQTPRELDMLEHQVAFGKWGLFAVMHEGEAVGHCVFSVDTEIDGQRVFYVNALGARLVPGEDVAGFIIDTARHLAKAGDCRAVRAWTTRRGLVRKALAKGAIYRFEMELDI